MDMDVILTNVGLVLFIVSIVALFACIIDEAYKRVPKTKKKLSTEFVKLPYPKCRSYGRRRTFSGGFYVVYHVKTRVMYAVSEGFCNHGTFTLLVNPDGKPMLYKPDEEEI